MVSLSSPSARALFLLGCIIFAEPLTSTLLFPFVFLMVGDFTKDASSVALRVGLITSSFFVCQLLTTPLWGAVADRIGRKPVLALGLLGGAVSMTCFGLSESLPWAMLSRGAGGLLNANMGIARTCLGEVAIKYRLKQSQAFGIFGVCSALGFVVGPLIGGLLARPTETFGLVGPHAIFSRYPYLLPCVVSTTANLAVLLGMALGLEETKDQTENENSSGPPGAFSERDRLLTAPQLADRKPKSGTRLPPGVPILMLSTALISMHGIMFDEIFPLFAAGSVQRGWGLGFGPKEIAKLLAITGPVILISQAFLYPILNARVHTIGLWKASAVAFSLTYPIPSLTPLLNNHIARQGALIAILCVRSSSFVVGWTSLNIITNQIADPARRGFTTSIVQAAASFSRATGPILGGAVWSWSESRREQTPAYFYMFFMTVTLVALLQLAAAYGISPAAATMS